MGCSSALERIPIRENKERMGPILASMTVPLKAICYMLYAVQGTSLESPGRNSKAAAGGGTCKRRIL